MSKHNQIKKHLVKFGNITGAQAWTLYGVYRLSSVINRLRNKGMKIDTEMIRTKSDQYAKYIYCV